MDSEFLLVDYGFLSVDSRVLLLDSGFLLADCEFLLVDLGFLPVDSRSLLVDCEFLLVDLGFLPVDLDSYQGVLDPLYSNNAESTSTNPESTGLLLRPRLHGTGFASSRHRVRSVSGHIYSYLFFYD